MIHIKISSIHKAIVSIFVVASFAIQISAQNVSFGWANCDGQKVTGEVTGGGNTAPVEVSSFSALKSAVESSGAKVIYVTTSMGNGYKGSSGDALNFKSNKTVIGTKPGIILKCSFQIVNAANIIVRNVQIQGPGSNGDQKYDNVAINGSSKRIWFDHCLIQDGQDGNFDFTKGADNLTVTWCKFTYTTNGDHNLSNLIGGSNSESASEGKLNATYAYCWWDNVRSRCPRTRYGKIHVLNCYYSRISTSAAYAGYKSNIRLEGSYFESSVKNPTGLISSDGQGGVFTIDCNINGTKKDGYNEAFKPPYEYPAPWPNSEVKSKVTAQAGNTLTLPATHVISTKLFENNIKMSSIPAIVSNNLSVTLNVNQGDMIHINLLSLKGRKVAEINSLSNCTGSSTKTLDLKSVQPGVYIVNVSAHGQLKTQQIIKQ